MLAELSALDYKKILYYFSEIAAIPHGSGNVGKLADYLEAFANLKVISQSSNFNPNSASNQFRQAMGMNMQGSETRRVSMYGNRYNFDKALKLFGAKANYGAQKP